jgi:hypothetical protein
VPVRKPRRYIPPADAPGSSFAAAAAKQMFSRLSLIERRLRKRRAAPLTSRACRDARRRLLRVCATAFIDEKCKVDRNATVRAQTIMSVFRVWTAEAMPDVAPYLTEATPDLKSLARLIDSVCPTVFVQRDGSSALSAGNMMFIGIGLRPRAGARGDARDEMSWGSF